ncbi:MAG TPA: glycosyltransferase family 4 protein [Myxococcota bacterium]|nr:glycosyltransferase family 4 protein [Myxococcota bacterium]
MKILVVSQFFPPEMGAPAGRFHDFAQNWIAQGHEVTAVTGFPNFPAGVIHEGYRGRFYMKEEVGGVKVHRCWILTTPRRLSRPLSYASFLVSSTLCVLFARLQYDVVVATIPPPTVGLPGLLAALRKRVPMVLDLRDIWPEAIVQSGRLTNPLVIGLFEGIANFLYRRAARITAVTEGWKKRLVEKGVPAEKLHVISNGVDVGAFDDVPAELPPAFGALEPGAHWFTYAGILNRPQGLEFILEAAAVLRDDAPDLYAKSQFVLIGEGPIEAELRASKEERGLDRVVFVPRQPRDAVYACLQRSFAVLVTLRPRKDTSTVPSKIYECMASGRPVLYQAGGEGANTLREAGGGSVVDPGSASALADAMAAYLRDPATADAHGAAGRDYVARHYDRRVLARRFSDLLAERVG